jgi:filamentous hemagglutinin family protein
MNKWLLFPIALTIWEGMAFANPQGGAAVSGEAGFAENGKALHITTGDRAIINWDKFSIDAGELTKFIQPGKTSAVLNRVTGTDVSYIHGTLEANGKVYLVNQNGLIIGKSGIVNCASFVGSTLDVLDDDFLQNKELRFFGDAKVSLVNLGMIRAWDGTVALLGYHVNNSGEIEASSVALAAGHEILLKPEGDEIAFIRPKSGGILDSHGRIEALKAELKADGNPYLLAINHSGKIDALNVTQQKGRVILQAKGGNIDVQGSMHIPEGEISISAENIILEKPSRLSTSSEFKGHGGTIKVIAENVGGFYGAVESRGGPQTGNGGFVELSGRGYIDLQTIVDRSAPKGMPGMLLIDPSDIQITAAGNSGNVTFGGMTCGANTYCITGALPNPANIQTTSITGNLALGPVTITTASSFAALGVIDVLDMVTWSQGTTLTLIANSDINIGSAVSAIPTGLNATGAGSIVLTTGGDLNVLGGNMPGASAQVTSDSGTITVTNARFVTLEGGSNTGCFAELSSRANNVTFTNITMDLTVRGSTGAGATGSYAQIGRGIPLAMNAIASNLIFNNINGNLSVLGGNASGAYAQIGHAPAGGIGTSTIAGNIVITSPPPIGIGSIGGVVTLQGNMGTDATAIIGHGNEFSVNVGDCQGNIRVQAQQGIGLTGGTATRSHAIIGFHSPAVGGMANFSCVSSASVTNNSIDVESVVINPVTLTAGTGSNAVIGYYNGNIVGGNNVTVKIDGAFNNITVVTPFSDVMTLQAGNTGGAAVQAGVAAIGTFATNGLAAPPYTTESNISLASAGFKLLGPAVGNDGSARIVNNRPGVSAAADISMNAAITGDVLLLGGVGMPTGFVEIYSCRNLAMSVAGRLDVNNDPLLMVAQNGPAIIEAYSQIGINSPGFGGAMVVTGGAVSTAEARIECLHGPVLVGDLINSGMSTLNVGSATSKAASLILSGTQIPVPSNLLSIINIDGSIVLQAGDLVGGTSAVHSSAEIRSDFIPMQITTKSMGSLSLFGGPESFGYAEISAILKDITFTIDNNILLQSGQGMNSYAQIGKGNNIADHTTISSNLIFNVVGGSITLQGSPIPFTGNSAYAQIGHAPFGGTLPVTVTAGNIDISSGATGPVQLLGADNTNCTAIIGHGNEITPLLASCSNSNISVRSTNGAILLQAGSVPTTHAVIGFHSPSAGSLFTVNSSTSVTVEGDSAPLTLNATNQANAAIGYYNGATGGPLSITITNINVNMPNGNDITLQAGNDAGSFAGIAAIGTFANAAPTVQSNISINTPNGTLLLNGPVGMDNGAARVINNRNQLPVAAPFDINISAGNVTMLGGTAVPMMPPYGFADMYSCNDLNMTFTGNLIVNDTLETGYAHIVTNNNCSINAVFSGLQASIVGGVIPNADALIESLNGNVTLGQFQSNIGDIFLGDSNSLATSKIVANVGTNSVNALNDITIQAGKGPSTFAWIQNTSGPILVTAGQNLSLTGGTGGDFASAEIKNDSSTIECNIIGNISLTGGGNSMMSNLLCYAQIGSNTGDLTFDNANNVYLTGGFGTQNYAQIGIGYAPAGNSVSSNISFFQIVGDVILQGQTMGTTGVSSYTQIGHSPFGAASALDVTGDINLFGVNGQILLNGGNNTNTTAIIGHGNELSAFVENVSSSILVQDNGMSGITLNPDTAMGTHAIIGFANPDAGSMVSFMVTSPQVSVSSSQGPITLNGGNDNNAVIGYYNATTPATAQVTINNLQVQTDPFIGLVQLNAGFEGPNLGGAAVIGTLVNAAAGNISQSNIVINSGTLNVFGNIGPGNGKALVTNNQLGTSTIGAFNFDVTLNFGTANILGQTGGAMGFAEVYSSRLLNIEFTDELNINRNPASPSTLQSRSGIVTAQSNILINTQTNVPKNQPVGDINVFGGDSTAVLSQMDSVLGNIQAGILSSFDGVNDITIGNANMVGSAEVFTSVGTIGIKGSGMLILQGGAGIGAQALLTAQSSETINMNQDISVTAGSGAGSHAVISTTIGGLAVTSGQNIYLQGTLPANLALVTNIGMGNGVLYMNAGMSIFATTNSLIFNQGAGPLTAVANVDIYLTQNSSVLSTSGDLTLVVDNAYPSSPGIGPGKIVKQATATIATTGGAVRIFTARQPQNQIAGNINGTLFVPGVQFVDTNLEQWLTYFPSLFGGVPFTIFYKDPSAVSPTAAANAVVPFAELFYDLKNYDDFLFFPHKICAYYERAAYLKSAQEGSLSTFEVVSDPCHTMLRRVYRNYNTKKTDPLK